jgi:hypothetical protein
MRSLIGSRQRFGALGAAVTLAVVLAAVPGAGAVQVPPGAEKVSGPFGLKLLQPPGSMTCDEQRVVVGVRPSAASRRAGVYAVRVWTANADGHGNLSHDNRLFKGRDLRAGRWEFGSVETHPCGRKFAVRYDVYVRAASGARHIKKVLFSVTSS